MILSKATLVSAPGRLMAGLKHLAAALAVVAFASGTASAQYNLTYANGGFSPTGVGGVYATVGLTETSNDTINFLVSATVAENDIVEFAFNSLVAIDTSTIKVYAGSTTASPLISPIQIQTTSNVSQFGVFTYDIAFSSNQTQTVLIQFTSTADLTSFVQPNTAGYTFVAHLKTPSNGTGFVADVPEPASVVMLGMSSLAGLGYAWRRRGRAIA